MRRLSVILLTLVLAVTACSDDGDDGDSVAAGGDTESTDTSVTPADGAGEKPDVEVPAGEPPDELVIEDLVEGEGAELTEGSEATVHYVGVAYSTGAEFDSSWDRGQPFSVVVPGQLIEGWNQGLLGMRVGGRRQLVIPPDLAYGERGAGAEIGPGETLVFVIDLLAVG